MENNRHQTDVIVPVDYSEVAITDCEFNKRLKHIQEFYLSIPTNDAFYEMRKKAGVDTRDGKSLVYGMSWFEEGGIVLGQWLQAFCRFYIATGDTRFLQRVREYVAAFQEVQKIIPDCYICGTTYMAEKVFHGLMDAIEMCGLEDAYPVLKSLYDNFREIPAIKYAKCRLGDNGGSPDETYREIEWYIFSESAYRFADMAREKGESEQYIAELEAFARKFEYDEFWNLILEEKNIFDYAPKAGQNTDFFHAFSHLNSFNSAMYIYWRTGEEKYLEMTKKFNCFLTETQTVATGGFGTILEWLLPKDRMIDALLHCHATFENQCNTYATLRQNRFLSMATGDIRYGNLSELLYYNSFLASIETDEQGHAFYYADYCADGGKKGLHTTSWTCCSGTRPLAAMEVMQNIYYRGKDGSLYINLFIPSEISCKSCRVSLEGDYVKDGKVSIFVKPNEKSDEKQILHIRKPAYLREEQTVVIKGAAYIEKDGQYQIEADLDAQKQIDIIFPRELYAKDATDTDGGVRAFMVGPLVLAAEGLEKTEVPKVEDFRLVGENIFQAGNNKFKPFMDYIKDEEYRMYFELKKEEMS